MGAGFDSTVDDKKRALRAAIAEAGGEVVFPVYSLKDQSFSSPDFVGFLGGIDAVIADSSHERLSCYHELGLAETMGLPVYPTARIGTPIHQCATRNAVKFYSGIAEVGGVVTDALARHGDGYA